MVLKTGLDRMVRLVQPSAGHSFGLVRWIGPDSNRVNRRSDWRTRRTGQFSPNSTIQTFFFCFSQHQNDVVLMLLAWKQRRFDDPKTNPPLQRPSSSSRSAARMPPISPSCQLPIEGWGNVVNSFQMIFVWESSDTQVPNSQRPAPAICTAVPQLQQQAGKPPTTYRLRAPSPHT